MRLTFFGKHRMATIVFFVALFFAVIVARGWLFPRQMEECVAHVVQIVPGPGVNDVKVLEDACDGIAASNTMSIFLTSRPPKTDQAVFVYGRKNADPRLSRQDVPPTVTWLGKDEVEISIDMVSYIRKKLDQVDGVKIRYRIGAIEYQ